MDTHCTVRENQKMVDLQQPSEFVVVRLKLTTGGLFHNVHSSHINVEYCHSVKSLKNVCKYVNKGSDMAVFGLTVDGAVHDKVR